MQNLQNETKISQKIARFIFWTIITIAFCWGWFSWADAAMATARGDTCAPLADISDYAYWECHGAACLADCNIINPDAPDYCAHVCAGVRQ